MDQNLFIKNSIKNFFDKIHFFAQRPTKIRDIKM